MVYIYGLVDDGPSTAQEVSLEQLHGLPDKPLPLSVAGSPLCVASAATSPATAIETEACLLGYDAVHILA